MKIFILMLLSITIFATTQQSDLTEKNGLYYKKDSKKTFNGIAEYKNHKEILEKISYKDGKEIDRTAFCTTKKRGNVKIDNDDYKLNFYCKNGKLHGRYLYDSRKNEDYGYKKLIKGYYKSGNKEGKWIEKKWSNNQLADSKISHYKNGLLHGRYSNKDECGITNGYYKNGKKDGEWKDIGSGECHTDNGIDIKHYNNGELNGYSIKGISTQGEDTYYRMYKNGVIICNINGYFVFQVKNNMVIVKDYSKKTIKYYNKNCKLIKTKVEKELPKVNGIKMVQ